MPKLPGVNHLRAVNALQKAGFRIDRHPYTMATIVRDAGMTIEEFEELL